MAEVLRNGEVEEVPVDRLVPGDVVELKAGDIVPATAGCLPLRPLRRPGAAHWRSLPRRKARGGSSVSRRGAQPSRELRLHGHRGHQRHRHSPRRAHRARHRAGGLAMGSPWNGRGTPSSEAFASSDS